MCYCRASMSSKIVWKLSRFLKSLDIVLNFECFRNIVWIFSGNYILIFIEIYYTYNTNMICLFCFVFPFSCSFYRGYINQYCESQFWVDCELDNVFFKNQVYFKIQLRLTVALILSDCIVETSSSIRGEFACVCYCLVFLFCITQQTGGVEMA